MSVSGMYAYYIYCLVDRDERFRNVKRKKRKLLSDVRILYIYTKASCYLLLVVRLIV